MARADAGEAQFRHTHVHTYLPIKYTDENQALSIDFSIWEIWVVKREKNV